jgi:hypothetical protein
VDAVRTADDPPVLVRDDGQGLRACFMPDDNRSAIFVYDPDPP